MKINITPDEFASIIMIYLLDKINNTEDLYADNEDFNKLLENIERAKSHLTKFYLNTELDNRIYYKRLRSVLEKEGIAETFTINIIKKEGTNESENVENINKLHEEESKISHAETKELVKDIIKRIRKRKFRKATYMSDEELDKIIAKAIKDKGEN